MFIHTVFFWLQDSITEQENSFFQQFLQRLCTIEHMTAAYAGVPAPTNREVIDNTYDYSLTFIFTNKEEQDKYQVHPIHKEFVEKCAHLWRKVIVYDAVGF